MQKDKVRYLLRVCHAGQTHAGEHVRHRAGNLDTEQPGNAKQEAEDASDETSPHKHPSVPFGGGIELGKLRNLSLEKDKWRQEHCRTKILPVRELDGGISGMRKGDLDENCVNGNKQRGEDAIEDGELARRLPKVLCRCGIRCDTDEEAKCNDEGREEDTKRGDRAALS